MRKIRGLRNTVRRLWCLTAWRLAIAIWCRRFEIRNRQRIPAGPVLIVANHASHADTVVLQFALASSVRCPLRVAGAEDYWFRNRVIGWFARGLGVFPFPRRGEAGPRRARRALASRSSVLIFPQGTRAGGRFRPGVGRIAAGSPTSVLPIHVSGTDSVLPRGSFLPRRGDVVIRVGEPVSMEPLETPEEFAARLERIVQMDLGSAA